MAEAKHTRSCSVESCERAADGGVGYCGAHYQRFAKYGDPLPDVPVVRRAKRVGAICSVDGCARAVVNGRLVLCDPHYKRVWRDPAADLTAPIAPERARSKPAVDLANGMRQCLECGEVKPRVEGFHRDKASPGGYRKVCKPCRISVETRRYWADPASVSKRVRDYRAANPERVRARDAEYYQKHRDARIDAATEASHRRRASAVAGHRDRGISKRVLRQIDGDKCCYCSVDMIFKSFAPGERADNQATLEHVVALSRGGTHTWDNCALACWRCNISKGARDGHWRIREDHRLGAAGISSVGA